MNALKKVWDLLDGKKVFLGYVVTQLPFLNDENVLTAISDLTDAAGQALVTHDPSVMVEPGLKALGHVLLTVGVVHRASKQAKGKEVESK